MRNIHCHELALVSGGTIQTPDDPFHLFDPSGNLSHQGPLWDVGSWNATPANSASPATAMQMIGTGALLAAIGLLALATAPVATAAGLTAAAVGLTGVGGVANLGGIAWAGYGWSLLTPP